MFFVILARDRPDQAALRAATKAAHMAHLDRGGDGVRVLQSGPLLSDDGREIGSLVIVQADAVEAVRAFADRDPYVEAGLFPAPEIREWLWRRGNPFLAGAAA